MKIISYAGIDDEVIVIQRSQDLYPLLDWFQTKLMDLGCAEIDHQKLSEIMKQAEDCGLGSYTDVENIEYE